MARGIEGLGLGQRSAAAMRCCGVRVLTNDGNDGKDANLQKWQSCVICMRVFQVLGIQSRYAAERRTRRDMICFLVSS